MTIAVLQPGYLPWLGFFDQMRRADTFVVYDDVQYDKHGWRNRNRIKTASGVQWLTVPVRHAGQGWPPVSEVRIDAQQAWARKHVHTLRQSYARAPFAAALLPQLEDILLRGWERLVDLDMAVSAWMAEALGVSTPVVRVSALSVPGEKSRRLLDICRHLGATRYLSGDAARDYLDVAMFAREGVDVVWQQYDHPVYPQQHGAFVSHLSAVDLLFNCGPDSGTILAGRQVSGSR